MSKVLEKTFGGFISSIIGSGSIQGLSSESHGSSQNCVSLGLINFVERLEAARKISKQEEEDIVSEDYQEWLRQASLQNIKNDVISDNLCRSLIAFCRGHYFANLHIHAIKLTQSDKLLHKKIGYLYISRTITPGSDLTVLLINTVQKDLSSPNMIQISLGLSLIPIIMSPEVSSLLSGSISLCLNHQQPYIRRRAAIMASSIICHSSETENFLALLTPGLLKLLTDTDPSVAIAAAIALSNIFKRSGHGLKIDELRNEIAVGSAHILLQATRGNLSQHYNSGPVTAPFVQVQMLRAIRNVSCSSWKVPQEVVTSVESVLLQPWGGRNLTLYMTLIEAISTVAALPKGDALISRTLKLVLGFLKSSLVDFKFLGIKALAGVFRTLEDMLTEAHLEAVLECLNSSSQLLQSRTIRLLCSMANQSNYQAICITLMDFASKTNVDSTRDFIHKHLCDFLQRIKPDVPWCVAFLSPFLECSHPKSSFLQTLNIVISKAMETCKSTEEKEVVIATCLKLFETLFKGDTSLEKLTTVSFILNIIFYEDPDFVSNETINTFIEKVKELEHFQNSENSVLDCLLNCGIFKPESNERVEFILRACSSDYSNLQWSLKSKENLLLLSNCELTKKVYAKRNQILEGKYQPDLTLTFCDHYVIEDLEKGAQPYKPFTIKTRNFPKFQPKSGSFNPFDVKESSYNINSMDKESFSTSGSVKSSPCGSSIVGMSPISRTVWTSKGRMRENMVPESNPLLDSEGSAGCVEIAHEADESYVVIDERKSATQAFLEIQRTDLAQVLFKGLGFKS